VKRETTKLVSARILKGSVASPDALAPISLRREASEVAVRVSK